MSNKIDSNLIEEGIFWNNKQKSSHSLHEVSYRATFNPNLPKYFIENYTNENDVVYDPFGGRGTTSLQAYLMKRNFVSNDINPLMIYLLKGRINAPTISDVQKRLDQIELKGNIKLSNWEIKNLSPFFNLKTLKQIKELKRYFSQKEELDRIDYFIMTVSLSRLTGHSKGYFSVYTLPPNQAISAVRQLKINAKMNIENEFKDIKPLIIKKTKSLLRNDFSRWDIKEKYLTSDSRRTASIKNNSIDLVVTSPPFINVVDYVGDNWIRNWFIEKEMSKHEITQTSNIVEWEKFILDTLIELKRVVRKGGVIAFEVGEVLSGKIDLAFNVMKLGEEAGLTIEKIFIQKTFFTKTAAIWGIKNNKKGTNTNRVVLFRVK